MKIRQYFELVEYRALSELRRGSADMYLGMLWWILEPLLYMGVFYLIFGIGLRKGGVDFVFYLLCGLVPWKWFDSTVRTSSGVILSSAGLMRQVYFPKWILPGYVVVANTYKFFIVLFLLLVSFLVAGLHPSQAWLAIPAIVALQFVFNISCALVASVFVPLVPDIKYLIHYGLTMLFFMSGIFFDVSTLAEPVYSWLSWIPTVLIIKSYRDALLFGVVPDMSLVLGVLVPALILLLVGAFFMFRLDRYYPRVVN